jgi:Na+/H+ antiporter NhaD/arsenite permease-like protein
MKWLRRHWFYVLLLIGGLLLWAWPQNHSQAQVNSSGPLVTGQVNNRQNQPVDAAEVSLQDPQGGEPLASTLTQPNGSFELYLEPGVLPATPQPLQIMIVRAHFQPATVQLESQDVQILLNSETVILDPTVLIRKINLAFWIATIVFILVLILIAIDRLHNTLAALIGASLLLGISYLGGTFNENLFIFDFQGALRYIDWNVIFLIMGMMIIIAIVERTGIFQWLAFMAYRVSGGRTWLLLLVLMLITGVASAFLDNVTTMLLMTPISVQIALSLGMNPLALIIPEVMASNVIGVSTLIGTPTNILIGSYAHISFNDFLVNLTPGVLLAFIGLVIYCELVYRRDLKLTSGKEVSEELISKLEERARITEPDHLKKAGAVGAGMLLLFIFGEHFHLVPAVTALIGATALLVWIQPDIEEMIEAVDWTTLVFFMTLFICVGAIQEVGLISLIADGIGRLVGTNLTLAILSVIWFSALLSTIIANIPFTAAMLPVVGFLTATIPGAESKVLFYCLSIGSAFGGNGSLIGASANMVTSGIAERAGYTISYGYFLKKGMPALLITVTLATFWILYHF